MATSHVAFNGVNGLTGMPLVEAMSPREMWSHIEADPLSESEEEVRASRSRHFAVTQPAFRLQHGLSPKDLSHAGWGLVLPPDVSADVRNALAPLCDHRRKTASRQVDERYREFHYRAGESKRDFMRRHGVPASGPVDPDLMPYYLLIVGSPSQIPYSLQYGLGSSRAVGRLHFEEIEHYRRYAETVVAVENEGPAGGVASFFAPDNGGDEATQLSLEQLAKPLCQEFEQRPGWDVRSAFGASADKGTLVEMLKRGRSLLFAATHGVGFPPGHDRQRRHQGGLVCQEWLHHTPIGPDDYLSADDVVDAVAPRGLIAFIFACFGAGTPAEDGFAFRAPEGPRPLAEAPFVAALPQRLLSHLGGGALAVIGHVDRAWGYSFSDPVIGPQNQTYTSCLGAIADGYPVGYAVEFFGNRYAELTAELDEEVGLIRRGKRVKHRELVSLWTERQDAKSFAVLGDPAVSMGTGVTGE